MGAKHGFKCSRADLKPSMVPPGGAPGGPPGHVPRRRAGRRADSPNNLRSLRRLLGDLNSFGHAMGSEAPEALFGVRGARPRRTASQDAVRSTSTLSLACAAGLDDGARPCRMPRCSHPSPKRKREESALLAPSLGEPQAAQEDGRIPCRTGSHDAMVFVLPRGAVDRLREAAPRAGQFLAEPDDRVLQGRQFNRGGAEPVVECLGCVRGRGHVLLP